MNHVIVAAIKYGYVTFSPANMRRYPNVGLLLAHRLRRWPNSKPTLGQRLMFGGRYRTRPCVDDKPPLETSNSLGTDLNPDL